MLYTVAVILFIIWILCLLFSVGGALIHILLVIAVVVVAVRLMR